MSNGENAYANESVNFTTICAQTLVQNLLNYYGMFNSNLHFDIFLTWKYKMMVHIKPNITGGLPSTISLALMLTSLICKMTDKG